MHLSYKVSRDKSQIHVAFEKETQVSEGHMKRDATYIKSSSSLKSGNVLLREIYT